MPFPQWFAGQTITADRLNAARMKMVAQSENQEVVNSTALVPTEIIIPLESGATYWYQLVLTYTARNTNDGVEGGGIRWAWDVPTGTSMPRQTASYALVGNQGISLIAGGRILLRSPTATTWRGAGGAGPDNAQAARAYGSIQVGGLSGAAVWQFAQWNAHSTPTTLRGATRTRVFYARVQ